MSKNNVLNIWLTGVKKKKCAVSSHTYKRLCFSSLGFSAFLKPDLDY